MTTRSGEVLADEPAARDSIAAGADLVCFSADKLLGGPQAGIVAGTEAAVARMRAHPLARAVRIDKLSLAALEATLRLHRDPARAVRDVPVLHMLATPRAELDARAERLRDGIAAGAPAGTGVRDRRLGGPRRAVARCRCWSWTARRWPSPPRAPGRTTCTARLRAGDPPIVARVHDDARAARPSHDCRGRGRLRGARRDRRLWAEPWASRRSRSGPRATSITARPRSSKALTGVDTDRLPQERERGISIELGFTRLALPSGRALSVVDVPGHERFVRTMVAGATGIDLFLLVIAADDGVMPQTREHLAVLEVLGVPAGVVALTKVDAVTGDAAGAWPRRRLPTCSRRRRTQTPRWSRSAPAMERASPSCGPNSTVLRERLRPRAAPRRDRPGCTSTAASPSMASARS